MKTRSNKIKILISIILISSVILGITYHYFSYFTKDVLHDDLGSVPPYHTALLLGTSRLMNSGDTNLYFTYRCQAAFDLWKAGKYQILVISGDSASPDYDEVEWMRQDMLRRGVPDSILILDKQGFNTLASLHYIQDTLQLENTLLISQRFHNQRAAILAKQLGLKVDGYNAKPVYKWYGLKTLIRECFARGYYFFWG